MDCEGIVWKWNDENFENPIKFHDDILPKIRTVKTNSTSAYFVGMDGSLWGKISNREISLLSNTHDVIDVFVPKICYSKDNFIDLLCPKGRIVRASSFSRDIKNIFFTEICPFSNVQSITYCSEKKLGGEVLSILYHLTDNSVISSNISTRWDISIKNVEKMENEWVLTTDGQLLSLDANWKWTVLKPAVGKETNIEIIDFVVCSPERVIFTDYSALYFGDKVNTTVIRYSETIPFTRAQGKKSANK